MEAESLPLSHAARSNFRRELYAKSADRSTIEDMADMVVHRVIGQAATCIEKSLGMKFSMPSMNEEGIEGSSEMLMETEESESFSSSAIDEKKPRRLKRSKVVEFPASAEFNKEQGLAIVEHIVDSWDLNCALWERHLELTSEENSPNTSLLLYKAIFYPICKTKRYIQITASVDFTLTTNHLDPQAPIRVEFKLEGQRFKHEPGQFRFREKWLMDIIEHKKKLIRQVSL